MTKHAYMKTCPNCKDCDGEPLELSYDQIKPHWDQYHCFDCGYDVQGNEYLGYEITSPGNRKKLNTKG